MNETPEKKTDLSAQIATAIRDAIIEGRFIVDDRLPSEAELADHFGVSRPTIREALKRLAAQSLIRTQRGAFGGAFINRLTYEEAQSQQITTSTLLLSMNEIPFETACEARFALESACIPLACAHRTAVQLNIMQDEIARQLHPGLSDEDFCASDVAFHRALVEAAGNPVLIYHVAAAIEAMQPLMNMITFTARSRQRIVNLHTRITQALDDRTAPDAADALQELTSYTKMLGLDVLSGRHNPDRSRTDRPARNRENR